MSNATNSPTNVSLSGTGIHAVDLAWTASTSTVIGYNVYRGTKSGGTHTKLNSSLVSGLTYANTTAQAGEYVLLRDDGGEPYQVGKCLFQRSQSHCAFLLKRS